MTLTSGLASGQLLLSQIVLESAQEQVTAMAYPNETKCANPSCSCAPASNSLYCCTACERFGAALGLQISEVLNQSPLMRSRLDRGAKPIVDCVCKHSGCLGR